MDEKNNSENNPNTTPDATSETVTEPAAQVETVSDIATDQNTVAQTTPTEESSPNKNMFVGIAVALLALGGGYWFYTSSQSATPEETVESTTIDPETVVATVNGNELKGASLEFQMIQAAELAGLPDLSTADQATLLLLRNQAMDAIVNTALLTDAAKDFGIEVTDEDVEAQYAGLVEGIGGEEAAIARLDTLGVSVDQFKSTLRNDLYISGYIEATTDETQLEVTEVEIANFYAEATGGNTEAPPLEEVSAQIAEQLKFQKQQAIVVTLLEKLRETADIKILI